MYNGSAQICAQEVVLPDGLQSKAGQGMDGCGNSIGKEHASRGKAGPPSTPLDHPHYSPASTQRPSAVRNTFSAFRSLRGCL